MKDTLRQLLREALARCYQNGSLVSGEVPAEIMVEVPANPDHGDFATNLALILAKKEKSAPRKVAEALMRALSREEDIFTRVEIAGPGFINFFLTPRCWYGVLDEIAEQGRGFGRQGFGAGTRVQVEFVSANPTGPLHIGHGRGAATGDALASLLAACGYQVEREYYINDAGNQMQTLGRSILLRCRELLGETVEFPGDCYQGEYIRDLAQEVLSEKGEQLLKAPEEETVPFLTDFGGSRILAGIAADLEDFGVRFDNWYSERSLYERGEIQKGIDYLREKGFAYEKDEALWFESTRFGDDKDRVMLRSNGVTTYFASDVAYHKEKFERGFDLVIDIWGADHHGYIPRMKAVVAALGRDKEALQVVLVQLVNLLRGGAPAAMSTRSGEFVTLREVMDEVGTDACRYYFLSRHSDSKLDFDLELAKEQSANNPVYYVQYAHARICSILKKALGESATGSGERHFDGALARAEGLLEAPEEEQLLITLARFKEQLRRAAEEYRPSFLARYLLDLARDFNKFYHNCPVLTAGGSLKEARLLLIEGVRIVLHNGLELLGIEAPEEM